MELFTLLLFLPHTPLCLKGYTENNQRKYLTVHFRRGLAKITVKNNDKKKEYNFRTIWNWVVHIVCAYIAHLCLYHSNKIQDQGQELLMHPKAL